MKYLNGLRPCIIAILPQLTWSGATCGEPTFPVNFVNSCSTALRLWIQIGDSIAPDFSSGPYTLCQGEKMPFPGLGPDHRVGYFYAESPRFDHDAIIWEGDKEFTVDGYKMLGREIEFNGEAQYMIDLNCDKVIQVGDNWEAAGRSYTKIREYNYGYMFQIPRYQHGD